MAYRSSRGSPEHEYEGTSFLERQNDQMLGGLREKISSLKRITIDIGEEAKFHNKFLNDMGHDMNADLGLLGSTMRKLGIVAKTRGNKVTCYLVLFSFFIFLCIYYLIREFY